MAVEFSYIVENDRKVQRFLQKAAKSVDDLRDPFTRIANDFYRQNKATFSLTGAGTLEGAKRWPDLKESTKKQKKRNYGTAYPILVATGRLAGSLINPGHPDTVKNIKKRSLELGTNVPYAKFHQYGTRNIPMRKPVFIRTRQAARWLNIIKDYIPKAFK